MPLRREDGIEVQALALRGPAGARLLAPADAILAAGGLGADAAVQVVHVDPRMGFALLAPDGALLAGVTALPPGATAPAAHLQQPDGARRPAPAVTAGADGTFAIAADAPAGAALLDADGAAVAYVTAPGRAVPVAVVSRWLSAPPAGTVEEVRRQLRARDPASLLEDAEALLAREDLELSAAIRALDALLAAETVARDRATFARILELLPLAFAQVIVRELIGDPRAALERGRVALARFGDDRDVLAVSAQAAAAAAEPVTALDLLARLRSLDAGRATTVFQSITAACRGGIERLSAAGRHQEAVAISARLADLAPNRADLAAGHARTLELAGRLAPALDFARRAAAIDPAHQALADRLAAALRDAATPGVVRIPYDPRTGSIRADVRIGGSSVAMVVDTGATLTTIPTAIATREGLLRAEAQEVRVETANGTVTGKRIRVPELRLGSLTLHDVAAVALDLPGSLAGQGLLGLSALRQVDVEMNAEQGELVIRRR